MRWNSSHEPPAMKSGSEWPIIRLRKDLGRRHGDTYHAPRFADFEIQIQLQPLAPFKATEPGGDLSLSCGKMRIKPTRGWCSGVRRRGGAWRVVDGGAAGGQL